MIFGDKLKSERKNKGWSQEDLAEKLFGKSTVCFQVGEWSKLSKH